MLRYLSPLAVQDKHLLALATAQAIKHPHDRLSLAELAELVFSKRLWLFEIEGTDALIGISFRQTAAGKRRLVIDAWTASRFGWRFRQAVKLIRKLAASLSCDGVETLVWDRRLALAMTKVGVKAEAVSFFLEASDG